MQPEPRRSMRRNRTQEALMAAWGFRTSAFAVYGERSHSCTFHTQCFYYRQMRPKPINDWVSSLQCSFQSLFSLNQNVFSGAVGHNDVCQLISCSPDIRTTLFLQTTVLVQPEVFFLSQIARKVGQPLFSFIYVHLWATQFQAMSLILLLSRDMGEESSVVFLTLKCPQSNLIFSIFQQPLQHLLSAAWSQILSLKTKYGIDLKTKKESGRLKTESNV